MKKFFKEFKEFAMRGNVIDMAVGIIIGAAFKSIVDSLIANFIQPLLDAILLLSFFFHDVCNAVLLLCSFYLLC